MKQPLNQSFPQFLTNSNVTRNIQQIPGLKVIKNFHQNSTAILRQEMILYTDVEDKIYRQKVQTWMKQKDFIAQEHSTSMPYINSNQRSYVLLSLKDIQTDKNQHLKYKIEKSGDGTLKKLKNLQGREKKQEWKSQNVLSREEKKLTNQNQFARQS